MIQTETILLPLIFLLFLILMSSHSSIGIINYFPSSTNIGYSDGELKILLMIIGGAMLIAYFTTHNLMPVMVGILLYISVACFANPLLHALGEIDHTQYDNIKIAISDRTDLISVLPNYVNADCEMTSENYKSFIALSTASNTSQVIKNLPIHKPVDQVKTMCAHKIFKI